jgi:methylated-DNA-[protein]-cysteine S-methyltransferase
MRNNNCPLVIPCHRVLGANGKLTGFSAGSGVALKHRLLQMEGINQDFVF